MAIHTESLFQEVDALTEVAEEWTVPTTEVWEVDSFQGAGAYLDDTTAALVWDYGGAAPVLIAATHGDTVARAIGFQVTGNGTKKLALVLTNDTNSGHVLGGRYEAKLIA